MIEPLEVAKSVARDAGKITLKFFRSHPAIKIKQDGSFVSRADIDAEKVIVTRIKKEYPTHAYYAEETGASKKKDYCWHIDPHDRTHNFLRGIPLLGVSIALSWKGRFILGVIYLPCTDELFTAEKNKGFFLNKNKISVSKAKLNGAFFAAPAVLNSQRKEKLKIINMMEKHCKEIRMFGSAVFSLSSLACGRADCLITQKTTARDSGAEKIIVEEAGGKLTKFDGSEFTTESTQYLASNGVFHAKLIKIVKEEYL